MFPILLAMFECFKIFKGEKYVGTVLGSRVIICCVDSASFGLLKLKKNKQFFVTGRSEICCVLGVVIFFILFLQQLTKTFLE